jgi:mannose-6-phosphate isomerase-like protein (cupin superfamily)
VEIRNLKEARRFSAEKMVKAGLFSSARLLYDLYCLEPGQAQKIHSHEGSDKVYLVLEGRALVTVGAESRELLPDEAALAPSGQPHGVENRGEARLVLLVVTTPPPEGATKKA